MTQQTSNDVKQTLHSVVPAPWQLQGSGYICLLRCPQDFLQDHSFTPKSLADRLQRNTISVMIFVDYYHSPVGPYHELLFIPGRFFFKDNNPHPSISRIFVSSMASVINGRHNWGIPKEIANFQVAYGKTNRIDRITVSRNGNAIADLAFRSWPVPIPFSTFVLPKKWLMLGQHDQDRTFFYQPRASGWLYPARLIELSINATEFPPVHREQVLCAFKITRFEMFFPPAQIIKVA